MKKTDVSSRLLRLLTGIVLTLAFHSISAQEVPDFLRPSYPSGDTAFCRHLMDNFRVPARMLTRAVTGTTRFRFVVSPEGHLSRIHIINSLHPKCDRELGKAIASAQPWNRPQAQTDTLSCIFEGSATIVPSPDLRIKSVHIHPLRRAAIAYTEAGRRTDSLRLYRTLMVEKMPQFPSGGEESFFAMQRYIDESLYFPPTAIFSCVSGRTIVNFIVDAEGFILYPHIAKGFDKVCDAEAIRIVRFMPRWIPGEEDGTKVPVMYTIPINFRLP